MDGTLAGAGSILNPSLFPFILGPDGMISLNFQAFSPNNAGKFAILQFAPLYMIYSSIKKNRFLYFKHQEMRIEHEKGILQIDLRCTHWLNKFGMGTLIQNYK